ncbi:MAG: germination protein YpeB [Firmicutes bacterium]|nr:germination protein YpeB [Bacillota bacterium]
MKGRGWLAGAGVAAALVVAGVLGLYILRLGEANRQLSLMLEAERQRNFSALVSHVRSLEMLLGKGLVTGSPRQNLHYMGEVRRHAEQAVAHFTGLPLPTPVSAATGKFLAQVGDFAYALGQKEAAGRPMSREERERLTQLRAQAAKVSAALQEAAAQMAADGFRWHPPVRMGLAGLLRGAGFRSKASADPQSPMHQVPGGLEAMGGTMEQLPAFVYDGPFSDHVGARQQVFGGPEVDRAGAEARLARYLPDPDRWQVTGVSESGGSIPTWVFTLAPATGAPAAPDQAAPAGGPRGPAGPGGSAGGTLTVEVAKAGGHLVHLVQDRAAGEPVLTLDQARQQGQAYLAVVGYPGMEPVYAEVADGEATIQYVLRQGEIRVYPDQIRVKVALDTGEVVGVDATPYLLSHRPRPPAAPAVSVEEAALVLNPAVEVEESRLALIPDAPGTGEILAYEFRVRMGDEAYLVYVNAMTGEEERVLQIIQTETGTFAL